MKTLVRGLLRLLMVLAIVLVGLAAYAYWHTCRVLNETFHVEDPPLPIGDADLTRGKYLYESRGCAECHGGDGRGVLVLDGAPVIQVRSANINPAGLGGRYDAEKLGAAIRHGLRDDGRTLVFMPSPDWADMSDRDTADIVAYVQSLPASGERQSPSELLPFGRVLYLFGAIDNLLPGTIIDHRPRQRSAPALANSVDYGSYLIPMCQGCHGSDLLGGIEIEPGVPPSPNINVARGGLAGWSKKDFIETLRSGRRPDGSALSGVMPWRSVGAMNETELDALWTYLSSEKKP